MLGQWIFPGDGKRGLGCKEHGGEMDVLLRERDWLACVDLISGLGT